MVPPTNDASWSPRRSKAEHRRPAGSSVRWADRGPRHRRCPEISQMLIEPSSSAMAISPVALDADTGAKPSASSNGMVMRSDPLSRVRERRTSVLLLGRRAGVVQDHEPSSVVGEGDPRDCLVLHRGGRHRRGPAALEVPFSNLVRSAGVREDKWPRVRSPVTCHLAEIPHHVGTIRCRSCESPGRSRDPKVAAAAPRIRRRRLPACCRPGSPRRPLQTHKRCTSPRLRPTHGRCVGGGGMGRATTTSPLPTAIHRRSPLNDTAVAVSG